MKNYGFNYTYNEKNYALHVAAPSISDAEGRVRAMSTATLFGELQESVSHQSQGTRFIIDGPIVEILRSDQPVARVPFADLLEFAKAHGLTSLGCITPALLNVQGATGDLSDQSPRLAACASACSGGSRV